jgi:endonuclease YncB( thermonuclease family)
VLLILLLSAVTTSIVTGAQRYDQWENDMTTVVSQVIDGDTFHTTSGDSIRLADINAPEVGQAGANEATNVLVSLVGNKTVYLDIDDVSRTDTYGRLVCVVYVDHNSTHVKNVNKALLVEGVAEIWDHENNEFDPYTWTLYNQKTETPEDSNPLVPVEAVIAILLLAAALIMILIKRKTRK